MSKRSTSIVLDPLVMNIVNRIAPGGRSHGTLELAGGLLLQGEHRGVLSVKDGPLVIYQGGRIFGEVIVYGDVYVFGTVGADADESTSITVMGTMHLTSSAVVYGSMKCLKFATYDGAQIHGKIETLPAVSESA